MWNKKQKFQNNAINILLALLIVYAIYALFPFLQTVGRFATLVLYPFLIAALFYYLLRPIVSWLEKRMSKYIAILLAYCILAGFFIFVIVYIYPIVKEQINLLLEVKQNIAMDGKTKEMIEYYLAYLNSL